MKRIAGVVLPLLSALPLAAQTPAPLGANRNSRLSERAHQDREIVYFLQQPETHAFDLYHDYTESRAGVDKYVNVVRGGSRASNPSALILDTGERLPVETLVGERITAAGIDIGEPVTPASEAVVIGFPRCRPDTRCDCGLRRPTPTRVATAWSGTSWSGTALSGARRTR